MPVSEQQLDLPGIEHLHRTAIRVGGAASAVAAIVFVLVALVTWDAWMLLSAVAPAILAGICIAMLRADWQRAEVLLVLAALSTTLSYKFFGSADAATPAAIGVVVVVAVGVLFVARRWQWRYVALGTIALFLTGPFWQGLDGNAIWIGVSAALSGLVAMVLFVTMRNAAVTLDRRYRLLVERVPVPLIEQDWSLVRDWVRDCKIRGVRDMEAHLDAHPRVLEIMTSSIRLRGLNPAVHALTRHNSTVSAYDVIRSIKREEFNEFMRREIISLFDKTPPQPSDHRFILDDGSELWARLHAAELDDAAIPGIDRVLAAIDITELKQTQARLAELVRSKDEFVAAVSHELRTPLTSILGFAELLATDGTSLSDQDRDMLEHLHAQANDMSHIVEDLLVAARADIGTVAIDAQPIELSAVVGEMASDLGEGFSVHLDAEPTVVADRVRVGQILRNLVTNATRYGGTERSIHVTEGDTTATIEVRDNGNGIAPDERERIFEPYTRAHDRPGMTASVGLGLAVSRQLAELMGGDLEYRQETDHSVFRLTLPLATAAAAGEEVA